MHIGKANNLVCPIDGARLESNEKQLNCENGHVFDMARQGYVNLLPVQHKRSKNPGDSKEMVLARACFLDSGVYEPIANKLAELVYAQTVDTETACYMDAGCGEGYYSNHVFNDLKDKGRSFSFIGLDISKPAIVAAAKRNKQIAWLVATNRHPPVEPASVDTIICVFGFQNFEGFKPILKPGGQIVLVEPGPDHLQELREVIYTEVKRTDSSDRSDSEVTGFTLANSEQLRFKTGMLDNERINNLLVMTPHFYRATKAGRDAASQLKQLDLTVDVVFRVLEKTTKT